MSEHCPNSQNGEPIKRVKGLPENEQCLKYPGYECNCRLSDTEIRRRTLRRLRQELGAYSFINILDSNVAENYDTRKKQLCEGQPPTFIERLKNFRIRIV
jgi:hypothetical protein